MSAPPSLAEVTSAVVHMLATVVGKPMGDGQAPPDGVERDGFGIIQVIPGGHYETGSVAVPEQDATTVIQVTGVGATRVHAQGIADRCRQALLARVPGTGAFLHTIDAFAYELGGPAKSLAADVGVSVWRREFDMDGGVIQEGPLFSAAVRYALTVGPAS